MGIGVPELIILFFIPTFILWVIYFFDVLRSRFPGNEKLIWFLAILFVPALGSIDYLVIGRKKKVR